MNYNNTLPLFIFYIFSIVLILDYSEEVLLILLNNNNKCATFLKFILTCILALYFSFYVMLCYFILHYFIYFNVHLVLIYSE